MKEMRRWGGGVEGIYECRCVHTYVCKHARTHVLLADTHMHVNRESHTYTHARAICVCGFDSLSEQPSRYSGTHHTLLLRTHTHARTLAHTHTHAHTLCQKLGGCTVVFVGNRNRRLTHCFSTMAKIHLALLPLLVVTLKFSDGASFQTSASWAGDNWCGA